MPVKSGEPVLHPRRLLINANLRRRLQEKTPVLITPVAVPLHPNRLSLECERGLVRLWMTGKIAVPPTTAVLFPRGKRLSLRRILEEPNIVIRRFRLGPSVERQGNLLRTGNRNLNHLVRVR